MSQSVHRVPLLDQSLPAAPPVGHVVVQRITMAPGLASGAHRHNSPVVGTIEQGSAVLQVEDAPAIVLRAGDAFHEPGDTTVLRFDAGDDGCVFLACYLLPDGVEPRLDLLT
jgi:quercetin dioxygenase-like cupin family protein